MSWDALFCQVGKNQAGNGVIESTLVIKFFLLNPVKAVALFL